MASIFKVFSKDELIKILDKIIEDDMNLVKPMANNDSIFAGLWADSLVRHFRNNIKGKLLVLAYQGESFCYKNYADIIIEVCYLRNNKYLIDNKFIAKKDTPSDIYLKKTVNIKDLIDLDNLLDEYNFNNKTYLIHPLVKNNLGYRAILEVYHGIREKGTESIRKSKYLCEALNLPKDLKAARKIIQKGCEYGISREGKKYYYLFQNIFGMNDFPRENDLSGNVLITRRKCLKHITDNTEKEYVSLTIRNSSKSLPEANVSKSDVMTIYNYCINNNLKLVIFQDIVEIDINENPLVEIIKMSFFDYEFYISKIKKSILHFGSRSGSSDTAVAYCAVDFFHLNSDGNLPCYIDDYKKTQEFYNKKYYYYGRSNEYKKHIISKIKKHRKIYNL